MPITVDFEQLTGVLVAIVSIVAAVFTALSVAMVIWTFRDMKLRSRDTFAQLLAALVVAVLNVPGLLVYLILRPRETLSDQYQRALEEEALLQEIEEKHVCPGCSSPTKDEWRLCPYCHTRLKKSCVQCNYLLELSWQICPRCETSQREGEAPLRSQSRMESFAD